MSDDRTSADDVDLKWLEDFACLARTRNFSKASTKRNVTQSAFSRRIASLEAWLGSSLVDHSSNPVTLTKDGGHFLATAEAVVQLLHPGREQLLRHREGRPPVVAVAALHTLALGFFPGWLQKVTRSDPPVESRLLADGLNDCIDAFRGGAYDFMLVFHHERVPIALGAADYPHVVVGDDRLTAVRASGNPRSDRSPLLGYPAGSFFGRMTAYASGDQRIAHVNDSAAALKSMVLAGHGRAWLPKSLIEGEIASGALTILEAEVPLQIRLYRDTRRRNRAADLIWKRARQMP